MEAVVRHLRDGRVKEQDESCPVALMFDDLTCSGGRDMMQHLISNYQAAFNKGLCQAGEVKLLVLEGAIRLPAAQPKLSVVDGCADPAGWIREAGGAPRPITDSCEMIASAAPGILPFLLKTLTTPSQPASGVGIIIDNLAPLVVHHSVTNVLVFLEQLRNHSSVTCVLAGVHQDVVGQQTTAALQRQASCLVQLQTASIMQQDVLQQLTGHPSHGYVTCQFKSRKAGRLRSEGSFYSLSAALGVTFLSAPPQLRDLTPEALASLSLKQAAVNNKQQPSTTAAAVFTPSAAVPTKPVAGDAQSVGAAGAAMKVATSGLPMEQAGGMRLTLTEEERQAKEAVVLPYEHLGKAAAYQTGDWRDYLPNAAGGRAGAAHGQAAIAGAPGRAGSNGEEVAGEEEGVPARLGQILYVRDSDDENGGLHDSDEDPDDDLDI